MINNNYICALDIGSSKIACALARVRRNRIEDIFFDSSISRGVKEGLIVDAVELISLVGGLIKNLKSASGLRVKMLHLNFSGRDISTRHSHAIIPLAERGNKVITSTDIQRADEQARILGSSLEEEIIHAIPSSYAIDSRSHVINPVGLYSHKLEVDLYLVCARMASLQSLTRMIGQSGYEIRNLSFSGLATSKAVLAKEHKNGICVLCDVGSDITEILLFKDGLLQDIQVLSVGGNMITAQLSEALEINTELAEDIKRSCGVIGDPGHIAEDKEVLVRKDEFYKPIKQRRVVEISTAAARVICSAIKDALQNKVSLYEISNFVIAGRAVLSDGFIEMMENTMGLAVKLGRINNPQLSSLPGDNGELCGQKYLTYLTCLGMICEELETKSVGILPFEKPAKNLVMKALNRFKEVYQEYF